MVSLPISHYNSLSLERENLIDINSISIHRSNARIYSPTDNDKLDVNWSQNNTAIDISITDDTSLLNIGTNISGNLNSNENNQQHTSMTNLTDDRIRRSIKKSYNAHFNPYIQNVFETDPLGIPAALRNGTDLLNKDDISNINDRILSVLPSNRTIHFDCKGTNEENCLLGRFTIRNFKANDAPIFIMLNFTIDMKKVASVLSGKRDILVIRTTLEPNLSSNNG